MSVIIAIALLLLIVFLIKGEEDTMELNREFFNSPDINVIRERELAERRRSS